MTRNNEHIDEPLGHRDRDDELAAVVADYMDRLHDGERVRREDVLRDHPELGPQIMEELRFYIELESSDALDDEPLGTLGDYTLRRQIGRGGMGVVYEAWENSMDRAVALKVLPAGVAADDRAVTRFVQEARLAGKLNHPNVVGVYGMGVKEQTPYYAMEFVEGETLAQILKKIKDADPETDTPFGPQDRQDFFIRLGVAFADVADGLQHAHSKGVTHRDIKPSNLILDDEGRLRILDFGLARLEGQESLTLSGDFVGTPLYMSPEQARRKKIPVDHCTDVYSLGATMYEAICGRPPFRGRNHAETLSQIIEREPVEPTKINPRVSRDLETIVLKCLRKDAGDRYGTAEALGQDLRRFMRGDPIEARAPSRWTRWQRRATRYRWRLLTAAVVVILCVIVASFGYRLSVRERENAARDYARRVAEYERLVVSMSLRLIRGELAGSRGAAQGLNAAALVDASWQRFIGENAKETVKLAVRELRAATEEFPERCEAHFHLARGLAILQRRNEALRSLDTALSLRPGFTPALAIRTALRGDEDASQLFDAVSDLRERLWLEARRAREARRWRDAAKAYGELLELERRDGELYLGSTVEHLLARGETLLQSREWESAKRDFWRADNLFSQSWGGFIEPQLYIGKTFLIEEKSGDARKLFEALWKNAATPDDAALWIAVVYRATEKPFVARTVRGEALEWIERIRDERRGIRLKTAICLARQQIRSAVAAGRRAVQLFPDDVDVHFDFGRALLIDLWQRGKWRNRRSAISRGDDADFAELLALERQITKLAPQDIRLLRLSERIASACGEPGRALELAARAEEKTRRRLVQRRHPTPSGGDTPSTTGRTNDMRRASTGVLLTVLLAGTETGAQVNLDDFYFTDVRPLIEPAAGARIDSPFTELSPHVTEDGLLLYFVSTRRGAFETYMASRGSTDEPFGDVRLVEETVPMTNGVGGSVAVSPDGLRLYLPVAPDGLTTDIAIATRLERWDDANPEPFGEATVITELSTAEYEFVTSVTADERSIFFHRTPNRAGGTRDLFEAWERDDGSWGMRELDEVNLRSADDSDAAISSDGRVLLFSQTSYPVREGHPSMDIWFAHRPSRLGADGEPLPFSPDSRPRFLEEVNTDTAHEGLPFLSFDWPAEGSKLYFARCSLTCDGLDNALWEATWRRRPPQLQRFLRGDCNNDGVVDIADPVYVLNYLFGGGPAPSCMQTADSNDDNVVDIADPVYQLNHLFGGGSPISAPVGECGIDPTPAANPDDDLSCEEYPPCDG